jgi:desert hedgehog
VVEGRGVTRLSELKVGDRVLSSATGAARPTYETVYFFGHQARKASAEFVRLEVDGGALALELTRKHLVPVFPGPTYVRAGDVRVGARVLVVDAPGDAARPATVSASSTVVRAEGIYAPMTTGGGHIIVSSPSSGGSSSAGVVASVHSDWLLDSLFEKFGAVSKLHAVYERVYGAPLKALYALVGPSVMRRMSPVIAGVGTGEPALVFAGLRAMTQAAPKAA